MKIWVDADGCPSVIRDILYRAVNRTGVELTLVANRRVRIPPSPRITFVLVGSGLDVADNEIVKRLSPGDLVITSDIPLAAEVVQRGGHSLNPRGEIYTPENIRNRLNIRDFMETLRGSGIETTGPPPLGKRARQLFANSLDSLLRQNEGRF